VRFARLSNSTGSARSSRAFFAPSSASSSRDFPSALQEVRDEQVGLTDALAYASMKERGVTEIYSFDKDFDRFGDIARVNL